MSKRSGIQLAYPFEERRFLDPKFQWRFPVVVQPKLDGERCRAVINCGKATLFSSECNEIISVLHINKQIEDVAKQFSLPELDGELYKPGLDFSEIHSIVSRKENIHEQSELMELHIFDFVSDIQQIVRLNQLTYYKGLNEGPIKLVPNTIAYNMTEIMTAYNHYLDLSYEGIIIRHINAPYVRKRSRFMLKFKPKKDDYYKIIEIIEATSEQDVSLNMIGAFLCSGSDGTEFKIGAGKLTHQERKTLWQDGPELIGRFAHVQYQNITSGGVPRFGLCIDIANKNPEESSGGGGGIL